MKVSTQIQSQALEAVSLFAAKKCAGRYNLTGTLLEVFPVESRLVATDGNALALCRLETPPAQDGEVTKDKPLRIPLPGHEVKHLLSVIGKGRNRIIDVAVDTDTNQLTFMYSDSSGHTITCPPDPYPNYMRLLPMEDLSGALPLYDPKYLMLFEKAAGILNGGVKNLRFHQSCRLYPDGPKKAGIVEVEDYPRFTGVIMPIGSIGNPPVDAWWRN